MPSLYRFRRRRPPKPDYAMPEGDVQPWSTDNDEVIEYRVGMKVEVYRPIEVIGVDGRPIPMANLAGSAPTTLKIPRNHEGIIIAIRNFRNYPKEEPLRIRFKGGIEAYASGGDVRPKRNGLRRFMNLLEGWAL